MGPPATTAWRAGPRMRSTHAWRRQVWRSHGNAARTAGTGPGAACWRGGRHEPARVVAVPRAGADLGHSLSADPHRGGGHATGVRRVRAHADRRAVAVAGGGLARRAAAGAAPLETVAGL